MWRQSYSEMYTGGDSSNRGCFGRKTNLFRESGDFAGNRETWEVFREKWDIFGILSKDLILNVIIQYICTVICTLCMCCILCILILENSLTPHDMKRPISNIFREKWDIFGTLSKDLILHVIVQYICTVICTLCMCCILCILILENSLTPHDMKRPISNIFREKWDIFGTLSKDLILHVIVQYICTVICTLCMCCILCILTLENSLTPHDMKRPISNVSN